MDGLSWNGYLSYLKQLSVFLHELQCVWQGVLRESLDNFANKVSSFQNLKKIYD